jgi:hypothetical protein
MNCASEIVATFFDHSLVTIKAGLERAKYGSKGGVQVRLPSSEFALA